jgi:hypothetical protein
MIIWNKEPIIRVEMYLRAEPHLMLALQQFTKLIALSPNAISIKCYDFERTMNFSSQFVSLRYRSCNDHCLVFFWRHFTELLMICCITVATFNMSLLDKLRACTDRPVFWISCCGRCCCCRTGGRKLFPCLRCLWLVELRILTQCSYVGLL